MRSALTPEGRRTFTIMHDLSGLEDGDRAQRYETYTLGIASEMLSPDDCRIMEGLSRRSDGKGGEYRNPATTGTGDRVPNSSPASGGQQAEAQPAEA